MRILVVSQYFWPESFRINDLVDELAARGHAVTVLTGVPNYPEGTVFPEFRRAPERFAQRDGVKIVRVPMFARGRSRIRLVANYLSFALSASIAGPFKLRGLSFDAIFVHETSPVTVGIPGIVVRAIKRVPLAFWVLDLWPDTLRAVDAVRSRFVLWVVGRLVAFIYDRCDLILAQSRSFIPEIARFCPDASRIVYFPSWAEPLFTDANDPPAAEVPTKADSFDVMFAGNIGEAQDFPSILAAAELLKGDPRIRWLIVGDGRMADWVREEVRRRDLSKCVLLLGRYPVERMPSFYKRANAMLVSLKDEAIFAMTIPGKLQSYLAAGVPIVAMLNGEGADVVQRASAGVTCPAGDASGLADAVRRLASQPPERLAEMGRNARKVSFEEFDRRKLVDRLEQWLANLQHRERGAPVSGMRL